MIQGIRTMADAATPQLVNWANSRVRTLADKIKDVELSIASYQADYTAQGLAAVITAAGPTNNIADGYTTDGRQPITGNSILSFNACLAQIQTALTTTVVPGVGNPPSPIVSAIQVNGSKR
jgi:hypothetical protein